MEKIIIEYNGWIAVDKNDLKIEDFDGNKIDTSSLNAKEIKNLLDKGEVILSSFADTYKNDTLDGEDDFTYDVEIDD